MTRATLAQVLAPCMTDGTAIAGLVVLGWEDALAFVQAAEAEGRPVILQAGPGCRRHTPLAVLGAMFTTLAARARVPVVAHLDHGEDFDTCRAAIACGFTSVMFDGSALPLEENIARTAAITRMAHGHGVSVEAELGHVAYPGGPPSRPTDPAEVAAFRAATRVDALAVSVGTTHLMTSPDAEPDHARLRAIAQAAPGLPLVLHGGSGLSAAARAAIVRDSPVCKLNIGTELRQCFGRALRDTLAADPALFDRNAILSGVIPPLVTAARGAIRSLAP